MQSQTWIISIWIIVFIFLEIFTARLFSTNEFKQQLQNEFSGNYRLQFHLAPPILSKKDPVTGLPKKREFGPWMLSLFSLLAKFKFLRATKFDLFAFQKERQQERALISEYCQAIDLTLSKLTIANHNTAVAIAELPEKVRGYGYVKDKAIKHFQQDLNQLLGQLDQTNEQIVHIMERVA